MSPELISACIAVAGTALIVTGWRMELATIPTPAPDQEGADDAAEAVPAEDL